MNVIKSVTAFAILFFSFTAFAEQEQVSGFISDELFVYMHTGPGKNYRIAGSINAGTEIKLTGKESDDYIQIIDDKERTTWVERKYISHQPGLRNVVAQLNSQLAKYADVELQNTTQIKQAQSEISALTEKNSLLAADLAKTQQELSETAAQLKTQDTQILTQWFFNGAVVLGIGLLLGLILPRIAVKKRQAPNWQ